MQRYDRSDNTFRRVVDVLYLAAMGPAGGGRAAVTPRYTRHFTLLACPEVEGSVKEAIFTALTRWWFNKCK